MYIILKVNKLVVKKLSLQRLFFRKKDGNLVIEYDRN